MKKKIAECDETGRHLGWTRLSSRLLKDAIVLCVNEVRGVARLGRKVFDDKVTTSKGVHIYANKDGKELTVDIDLCIEYGNTVADVAYRVQEAVINTANQLTDRKISRVNVYVRGTKYKEPENKSNGGANGADGK